MAKRWKRWTEQEVGYLRKSYQTMRAEDIAIVLQRTTYAVRKKSEALGIKKEHRWREKDLTDQRFERLVVRKRVGKDKYLSVRWLCDCDCGGTKIVTAAYLQKGGTRSCGCLLREARIREGKQRAFPPGEAAFNNLYTSYKGKASNRNLIFKLTKEEFRKFTKQDCYYCGVIPTQVWSIKNTNGSYVYNGVDRVDNTKGYTKDNCVACCGECNWAKGTMTQEDFIAMCKRIAAKHSTEEEK